MSDRSDWTRRQLLVALDLYCRMPFGRMHSGNPEIIEWAARLGRTPSALAMKLTNFASLDPAITSTGRKGLIRVSAADTAIWEQMQADWERFAVEAEEAKGEIGVTTRLEGESAELGASDEFEDYTGKDKEAQAKIRIGQVFFRRAVLSAYGYRCCITGLSVPALLVASHIVPWRADPSNRLNPRNGLCLSALHDRSFDAGIITIAEDMTIKVSRRHAVEADHFFDLALLAYEGRSISLPEKFSPGVEFLDYHRQYVFQR